MGRVLLEQQFTAWTEWKNVQRCSFHTWNMATQSQGRGTLEKCTCRGTNFVSTHRENTEGGGSPLTTWGFIFHLKRIFDYTANRECPIWTHKILLNQLKPHMGADTVSLFHEISPKTQQSTQCVGSYTEYINNSKQ